MAPIQPARNNSTRRSFTAMPEGENFNNCHEPDNHLINMPTIVRDPSSPREGGEASERSSFDRGSVDCAILCGPRGYSAMRHLAEKYKLPRLTTYVISP